MHTTRSWHEPRHKVTDSDPSFARTLSALTFGDIASGSTAPHLLNVRRTGEERSRVDGFWF